MIDPNDFYDKNDIPRESLKRKMWVTISRIIVTPVKPGIIAFDRKSFAYGMAASFIIMFTCIGVYSTFKQLVDVSQPQEIRTDKAYQSAIHEFENVVFSNTTTRPVPENNAYTALQNRQLQLLNEAIKDLREETNSHDLSPLKRQRLHGLYNMKLTLLQEMIQQGKTDL